MTSNQIFKAAIVATVLGSAITAHALVAPAPGAPAAASAASKPLVVKAAEVAAAKLGGDPVGPSLAELEALNRKAEVVTAERALKERMTASQGGEPIVPPSPPKMVVAPARVPLVPAPPTSGVTVVSVMVMGGVSSADLVLPGGARYMAKQGEILPGGWRVAAADMNGVVVEQLAGGTREVLPRYVPPVGGGDASSAGPITVPPELRDRLMRLAPGGALGPRPDSAGDSARLPLGPNGARLDSTAMGAPVPPLPR